MRSGLIKKGGHYIARVSGWKLRVEVIDDTPRHPMAWKVVTIGVYQCPGTFLLVAKDFLERVGP